MELLLTIITILLAIALGVVLFLLVTRQNSGQQNANLQNELQNSLQQNLQTILQQLNQQQTNQQQSSSILHSRVAETSQAISAMQTKLSTMEEGSKRILDMHKGITELQNILQAPKLRGERGEMWLEELLAQMIPRSNLKMQYRFKSGEICDAVVLLRDNLLLPIDSKFSLENFKKMVNAEDPAEQKTFEKVFCTDIKKRIDEISKKYILPDEQTLGFAFMYIPAENVYYQAFIEDKNQNELQRYAYDKHVIPVSPNSLFPYLEIVLFGLKGFEIEKSARDIQQSLQGIQGDLAKFDEEYRKVGNNLRLAQQNFEASDKRLGNVQHKLTTVSTRDLPEPSTPVLPDL